jgi:signal transduction histidine kinase
MNIQENFAEPGKAIAEKLIDTIERDRKIPSSSYLGYSAIEDSLPTICQIILQAIADKNLSLVTPSQLEISERHGCVRSEQEFNPEEIVREFYLLKQIILAELRPQLLNCSPEEILQKLAFVDEAIEEVMENSFQSYAKNQQYQLEKLHQQIFLTNQELTRLIEDRQNNISYLTHEIKNPLTSIIGYSDLFIRQQQLLCAENNSSISNLSHIHQVLQQGRKVLRLVNDSLEISSYQQGILKLRWQKVNVCKLVEDITFGLKSSIEAKQLDLVTECLPEPLEIETDSLRLQQIITNLLVNAIRYTPSGKIELTCHQIKSHILEIKITDTGVGIPESEQKRIFEPYFRSTKSQKNVPEGIGLGLAIVAQLVSLLKGQITLFSEVNVGSTFTVTIPLPKTVKSQESRVKSQE